ncbi:DUF6216 family protein [Ralstonia solanacearum]|uniref:DUF6216 family protein n=1 Tax=Ralstonia solanacearum TaxID=305 RepID=UPI000AA17450|nr:DUF6216 family protein [Ralstonia solanacearum]
MDAFSSIFGSPLFGQLIGPLLSVGAALFGLFVFWRRADSLHAIWEKVWRLVAGGAEVQEPRLRAFMQEMRDLEKFRLVYGLKISNMSDMHRLIGWVRRHSLDMAILQKARRWVDISKPEIITLPPRGYFFRNGLGYFLAGLLAAGAAFIVDSPALLQMTGSKIWFTSDGTAIGHLWQGKSFKLNQCSASGAEIRQSFGFPDNEVKAICDGYTAGSLQKTVARATGDQKSLGVLALFFAAIGLIATALRIRSGNTAHRIADRVSGSKTGTS